MSEGVWNWTAPELIHGWCGNDIATKGCQFPAAVLVVETIIPNNGLHTLDVVPTPIQKLSKSCMVLVLAESQ